MTIELSIFTNCINTAPSIAIIKKTYESFVETFGEIPYKIYLDPHPNEAAYPEYKKNLEKYFKGAVIIPTTGLSDGYKKSIRESGADYLFQLEHDWSFVTPLIGHSLQEIMETMTAEGIYHFRFSKHENRLHPDLLKWQTIMTAKECRRTGIRYCETDNLSNNPHIIDRRKYLGFLDRILTRTGARGIEENLTKKGLVGCQYGGLNYPPTIKHLQGRKQI